MSYYNSIEESHKYNSSHIHSSHIHSSHLHSSLPPSSEIISDSSMFPPPTKIHRDDSTDKVREVKIKVEQVKNDITNNIERVLSRGEKLEDTEKRALSLENSSNIFRRRARRLKCMFCTKRVKIVGCIMFCIIAVLILIFSVNYSLRSTTH
jgi:hypothetical protein